MEKPFLGLKFRQGSRRRIAGFIVPRADILADVAAKDVMPHLRPQFFRHAAALFNGEISDA